MKVSSFLFASFYAAFGVEAHSAATQINPDTERLTVSLVALENTKLEVTLTNRGKDDLRLLKVGTLLDERPVRKVIVYDEQESEALFLGIELSLQRDGLKPEHYEELPIGASATRVIDAATIYDFQPGTYTAIVEGKIPILPTDTDSKPALDYRSNKVSFSIEQPIQAEVHNLWSKRTLLEDNCTTEQHETVLNSIHSCETLARAAAKEATDVHSTRFLKLFKSNETKARELVSGRLLAVAEECSTINGGETRVFCNDKLNYCETEGPLIAYTIWVNGYVTLCPLFYGLTALPAKCHWQDQASTVVHEMTHARPVYPQVAATNDYAYGYDNSTALDPLTCLYNADSYSLYAADVYLDC